MDNIATPATFNLSDSGEQRFDNIRPGTYTVQESVFSGESNLELIECVDSDTSGTPSEGDLNAATAVIRLDAGETVECTFTNSNTPLAVTLAWFLAEANGDLVDFRWQTATETGVAGFNLLGVTEAGKVQLNGDLIPSPVGDSLTPTDYAVSLTTDATTFYLEEASVNGRVTEHGPFALGEAHGSYIQPDDVDVTPRIWLPIQAR